MSFVTQNGPIFDGRASHAVRQFCDDWEKEYAHDVEQEVNQTLSHVLRHPTGYYQSQIHVAASGDGQQVTDGGVIYGPWLEGTGSRNRTTRFKGYATFRRVTQKMDAKAGADAEALLQAKYLRRMQ